MSDKLDLLEEVDLVLNPKKKLDATYFAYIFFSVLLTIAILFPKIYIQQQIYFTSRDISKLKSEYETLKEENRLISSSVESMKFKNQILDTLF